MATETKFSRENTIVVSIPSDLNLEQSQTALGAVLSAVGHPRCCSGFRFEFLDETASAKAHIVVGKDLKAAIAI
jgi:hypothetical protein